MPNQEEPVDDGIAKWDVVELEGYAVTIPTQEKVDYPWCYTWFLKEVTLVEAVNFAMGFNCALFMHYDRTG